MSGHVYRLAALMILAALTLTACQEAGLAETSTPPAIDPRVEAALEDIEDRVFRLITELNVAIINAHTAEASSNANLDEQNRQLSELTALIAEYRGYLPEDDAVCVALQDVDSVFGVGSVTKERILAHYGC